MSTALPISVLLLARDEAARLDALLPTLAFAREVVVVVDAATRDATREVAARAGARVLERALDGFGPQRQFALAQCREPWVLWIDADERLDAGGGASARRARSRRGGAAGYRCAARTWFLGGRSASAAGGRAGAAAVPPRRARASTTRRCTSGARRRARSADLAGDARAPQLRDAGRTAATSCCATRRPAPSRRGARGAARRALDVVAAPAAALPAHVRAPARRAGRRARRAAVRARGGAGVPQVRRTLWARARDAVDRR